MKHVTNVADAIAGFTNANFKPHVPLLDRVDSISVDTRGAYRWGLSELGDSYTRGLEFFSGRHVNYGGAPVIGYAPRDIAEIVVEIVRA